MRRRASPWRDSRGGCRYVAIHEDQLVAVSAAATSRVPGRCPTDPTGRWSCHGAAGFAPAGGGFAPTRSGASGTSRRPCRLWRPRCIPRRGGRELGSWLHVRKSALGHLVIELVKIIQRAARDSHPRRASIYYHPRLRRNRGDSSPSHHDRRRSPCHHGRNEWMEIHWLRARIARNRIPGIPCARLPHPSH